MQSVGQTGGATIEHGWGWQEKMAPFAADRCDARVRRRRCATGLARLLRSLCEMYVRTLGASALNGTKDNGGPRRRIHYWVPGEAMSKGRVFCACWSRWLHASRAIFRRRRSTFPPPAQTWPARAVRYAPWRTIQHATSRMPDDGSTLVLLDGLYDGGQAVARQFSNFCTVRAEHAYRARLRGGPGSTGPVLLTTAANVIFQGLEIRLRRTQGEYLVHISTAQGIPPGASRIASSTTAHNNDMVKINSDTHHVLFRNCVFYNQTDGGGFQHFDINTCADIRLEDSICFNDYAGSGEQRTTAARGSSWPENSGDRPDVTRRIALRRNIFLSWDGAPDMAFILLGEDGKPFFEGPAGD